MMRSDGEDEEKVGRRGCWAEAKVGEHDGRTSRVVTLGVDGKTLGVSE